MQLHGHRGARGLFAENTLAGFRGAIALGVDAIELDVGMTEDDVVVVSHDPQLNPDITRDPAGAWLTRPGPLLRAMRYAELARYDVGRIRPGSEYARAFPDQAPQDGARIPRLDEVLALDATVRCNIELKTFADHPDRTVSPERLAAAVMQEAASVKERVIVQSFDWRALRWLRRAHPSITLSWLTDASVTDARRVADEGGPIWAPEYASLTGEAVEAAHRLGLKVIPWTVNDPAEMRRLAAFGVDGMITDRPDRFLALWPR